MRAVIRFAPILAACALALPVSAHRLAHPRRAELRLRPLHATLVLTEQLDEGLAGSARDRFDRDASGRLEGSELDAATSWLASRISAGIRLRAAGAERGWTVTSASADEHLAIPEPGEDHPFLTIVLETSLPNALPFDLSVTDDAAPEAGTPVVARAEALALSGPSSGRVQEADARHDIAGAMIPRGGAWSVRVTTPDVARLPSRGLARAWHEAGRRELERRLAIPGWPDRARNVVLVVGDGMGISTLTAARILEGQRRGMPGEEHRLAWESFPHVALVKVYSANQQVPDSAPTMTAMVTGVKTNDGLLSVDETVPRGDHEAVRGRELRTLLEMAEEAGLATGLVTTTRITHATPAACYAHSPDRDWESDADLSAAARESGFPDIARQLVEFEAGDGIDVVLGGGRHAFLPASAGNGGGGSRLDGRDLVSEWRARKGPAARVATTSAELRALGAPAMPVLGLFASSHMRYEADRAPDSPEPSLTEMASHAVRALSVSPKGWFLMVEGGRIDHGHHEGSARRALLETVELSRTVEEILKRVDLDETLVLVTADHSHPLNMAGYATRGNPILGLVTGNDARGRPRAAGPEGWSRDLLGLPYATLSYANGPGHAGATEAQPEGAKTWLHAPTSAAAATKGRPDLARVNTAGAGHLQESLVPLNEETHSGEDVPAFACGAGSRLVGGTIEQNTLFFVMARALGLPVSPP